MSLEEICISFKAYKEEKSDLLDRYFDSMNVFDLCDHKKVKQYSQRLQENVFPYATVVDCQTVLRSFQNSSPDSYAQLKDERYLSLYSQEFSKEYGYPSEITDFLTNHFTDVKEEIPTSYVKSSFIGMGFALFSVYFCARQEYAKEDYSESLFKIGIGDFGRKEFPGKYGTAKRIVEGCMGGVCGLILGPMVMFELLSQTNIKRKKQFNQKHLRLAAEKSLKGIEAGPYR